MRGRLTAALVLVVIAGGTAAVAQRGWRGGWSRMPPKFPVETPAHRAFTFSRILYDSDRREPGGQGWYTDYPTADQNLMIRLSELTTTRVGFDEHDEPDHVVVRLTDEALFNYPFIFMSDVGTLWLDDTEAHRLGQYLLKGGFLWVDDFWGPWAWEQWTGEIAKALPEAEYPIFDITSDHPLRQAMYEVPEIPQIPSIQHWRRTGGATTSERGSRSHEVHFRGIADKAGRLMVLMSHNTDIADGWEREGEDYEFFYRFSINAYAVGINTVVHAMTH
ncbi:MAG: DUF4159 domain-containing protein [Acidobacteria bacterium]|nr:DUF4159 domain-containing protein [Acidobacteriota bacterium]